jgi:hypothetical protein
LSQNSLRILISNPQGTCYGFTKKCEKQKSLRIFAKKSAMRKESARNKTPVQILQKVNPCGLADFFITQP